MKLPKTFTRLLILAVIVSGGYFLYQKLTPTQRQDLQEKASQQAQQTSIKVRGLADSFNIDADALLDQASKKLLEKQPIIDDQKDLDYPVEDSVDQATSDVQGVSDSQDLIKQTTDRIVDEVKSLPRQQAAQVTRQVCEQIIDQLEEEN